MYSHSLPLSFNAQAVNRETVEEWRMEKNKINEKTIESENDKEYQPACEE